MIANHAFRHVLAAAMHSIITGMPFNKGRMHYPSIERLSIQLMPVQLVAFSIALGSACRHVWEDLPSPLKEDGDKLGETCQLLCGQHFMNVVGLLNYA